MTINAIIYYNIDTLYQILRSFGKRKFLLENQLIIEYYAI